MRCMCVSNRGGGAGMVWWGVPEGWSGIVSGGGLRSPRFLPEVVAVGAHRLVATGADAAVLGQNPQPVGAFGVHVEHRPILWIGRVVGGSPNH